jgi:hypothetical protein
VSNDYVDYDGSEYGNNNDDDEDCGMKMKMLITMTMMLTDSGYEEYNFD